MAQVKVATIIRHQASVVQDVQSAHGVSNARTDRSSTCAERSSPYATRPKLLQGVHRSRRPSEVAAARSFCPAARSSHSAARSKLLQRAQTCCSAFEAPAERPTPLQGVQNSRSAFIRLRKSFIARAVRQKPVLKVPGDVFRLPEA